jgi:hypothetical protein
VEADNNCNFAVDWEELEDVDNSGSLDLDHNLDQAKDNLVVEAVVDNDDNWDWADTDLGLDRVLVIREDLNKCHWEESFDLVR